MTEQDIVIELRKLGYTIEKPSDKVEWTKGFLAGVEAEHKRRKRKKVPQTTSIFNSALAWQSE